MCQRNRTKASSRGIAFRRRVPAAVLVFATCILLRPAAGATVAVIGLETRTQKWCDLLSTEGHSCVMFPLAGPDAPLTSFDVVIDLSGEWTDPSGLLAERMRAGAGVITHGGAPNALGINSNSTVQAWIGANETAVGSGFFESVATDPILGDTPPGTSLDTCNDFACAGLRDISGRPNAKVLAVFPFPYDSIAILRNTWEGGRSVFFTTWVDPVTGPGPAWILNAVRELAVPPPIPAASTWGLVALALLLASAASVLVRTHTTRRNTPAAA